MTHQCIALATAIILLAPQIAWGGEAFTLSLPELIGPVAFSGDLVGIQIDFDFEREFIDINRVVLIVQAVGTPALVETCASGPWSWDEDLQQWQQQAPSCETKVVSFDLIVSLAGETTEQHTHTTVGDFRNYPLERAGVFQRGFGAYSFDQLRDGAGGLTLEWNHLLSGGGSYVSVVEAPSIEILDATILVEGRPVPQKPRRRLIRWLRDR